KFQPHRAAIALRSDPIELLPERERAAARLVAARMISDVEMDDAIEASGNDSLGILAHHHGMIEVVGDADLGPVHRRDDVEPFLRAGELVAGMIDPVMERFEAEPHT